MLSAEIASAKILIVDDQKSNVMLLEKILQSAGYTHILGTTDPRRVALLHAQHRFDLILLDLNMPHLDGFQVMEQLRLIEADSYLSVLVLTARNDMETRVRALQSGARDFVGIPFEQMEVLTRIRNLLEFRLMHNQIRNQNRLLEQKVKERTQELFDTRLEIIRRLGRAAEYRDNETGLHIIRISKFASALARAYGLSDAQCDIMLHASPMHDIGKIGIPDRVLLKPGKLDPEEWEIMKRHTNIGAEILSGHNSELLETARVIALTHHECWDGSGYPNGLKGDQIPLEGRIVAVCDVFDALTSERPYKRAWPVEDAIAYITDNAGRKFDPVLVKRFREVLPEIVGIKEEYADPEDGDVWKKTMH